MRGITGLAGLAGLAALAAAALLLPERAAGLYLPGVVPRDFLDGEEVFVKMDKLTSVQSQIPFSFYDLPFCTPAEAGKKDRDGKPQQVENRAENLGEVLAGDRMETSPYSLKMRRNKGCTVLCRKLLTKEENNRFVEFLSKDYRVNMWLDNLPVAERSYVEYVDEDTGDALVASQTEEMYFQTGYPLGVPVGGEQTRVGGLDATMPAALALNNHLSLLIRYHEAGEGEDFDGARIVGFEVVPKSVKHVHRGAWPADGSNAYLETCNDQQRPSGGSGAPMVLRPAPDDQPYSGVEVIFSYEVRWVEDPDTHWTERWDMYFRSSNSNNSVHWMSIINSLFVIVAMTSIVGMILVRTLYRDIAEYNDVDEEELAEDTGWKLVHGDVFRPPGTLPMLLSVLIGCGSQLFVMTFVVLSFACLGFLSPANRGSLVTALVLLFILAGALNGYRTARTFKFFGGKDWKRASFLSAFAFPGSVFVVAMVLNTFLWARQSVAAMPFGTIVALLVLWFIVCAPLNFVGSYCGFSKAAYEVPCATHQIPRQIPPQPWYFSSELMLLLGGIFPFTSIFLEMYFVMSALWMHTIYYVFGFLFVVVVILCIACAQVSIIISYVNLCKENYVWWWRAFGTSATTGFYVFLYAIYFFSTKLEISDFTSVLLYYGYMGVASTSLALFCGTVGFEASFWFIRKIFGAIKVD